MYTDNQYRIILNRDYQCIKIRVTVVMYGELETTNTQTQRTTTSNTTTTQSVQQQ